MRLPHAGENISMTYSVLWVIANDSVTLSMNGSRHTSNITDHVTMQIHSPLRSKPQNISLILGFALCTNTRNKDS